MMNQKQIKDKCKYLQCTIPVYYFDEFNFEKEYTESNFPCRTTNGAWQVTIDIKSHKILEWKDGFGKLHLFSKVVDEGTYSLLDENKQEFYRIEGYVPNHILPETDGFGDYLTLEIDADGTITNWYKNISFKDFVDNGFSTILPTDINNIKNFFMKFLLPSMQKLDLEFDKLTKGLFYESGVYFDLNSRNFDGFYVNSDYAKLQFNNDLDKKAQLISVFYLRYQGRAPIRVSKISKWSTCTQL